MISTETLRKIAALLQPAKIPPEEAAEILYLLSSGENDDENGNENGKRPAGEPSARAEEVSSEAAERGAFDSAVFGAATRRPKYQGVR